MKQLAFMALTTALGIGGTVLTGPFVGVLVYYCYAVLRPQFLWEWSLRNYDLHHFQWSFYVAVSTMAVTALTACGVLSYPNTGPAPGYPRPRLTGPHFAVWAFAGWVTLSMINARHPAVAWVYYLEQLKLFVMFTVAAFAVRRVGQVWWLLVTVTLTAVYVAYELNFFYLTGSLPKDWVAISGGLDNNGLALMFAMMIPVCYFLWENTRGRFRWAYVLAVAVLGHAVLLSFSRGAMLSLVVSVPLLLVYSSNRRIVAGFLALAAVGVVATAGPQVQARFLSISAHEVDGSANSRKNSWAIAIRMAMEEPVFGFGVRNSNLYTKAYGADIEGRSIHSQYLQLAADSGPPSAALFVLALGLALRSAWKARALVRGRTDPDADRVRAMTAGVSCGLVVYSVGAFFLSLDMFEMPYVLMLVAGTLHGILPAGSAAPSAAAPAVTAARAGWPHPTLPMAAAVGRRPQPAGVDR